jgi:hypothetical protein
VHEAAAWARCTALHPMRRAAASAPAAPARRTGSTGTHQHRSRPSLPAWPPAARRPQRAPRPLPGLQPRCAPPRPSQPLQPQPMPCAAPAPAAAAAARAPAAAPPAARC